MRGRSGQSGESIFFAHLPVTLWVSQYRLCLILLMKVMYVTIRISTLTSSRKDQVADEGDELELRLSPLSPFGRASF